MTGKGGRGPRSTSRRGRHSTALFLRIGSMFSTNLIRLAGVLAHERAHIEHGQNEELPYLAQLTTLEHLRAHDIDIANVRRALEAVKRQQHRRR